MEEKYYSANVEQKKRTKKAIAQAIEGINSIAFVYIFGSFIEEMPFHDIDLGVYFIGEDQLQMADSALEVAVKLSRETGYPVDVRVLNGAPVSFIYNVLRGELISENNADMRCEVMENTVRKYLDMKPLLDIATKEAFSYES